MKLPAVVVALVLAVFVAGCGKKDTSIAKKTGETLGQGLSNFTQGVGSGIDKTMTVKVNLASDVQARGLTTTIAKSRGLDADKKVILIYFIASQDISNNLVVRALGAEGVEIGRCKRGLVMQRDDADYVEFEFPVDMDTQLVHEYAIGLGSGPLLEPSATVGRTAVAPATSTTEPEPASNSAPAKNSPDTAL